MTAKARPEATANADALTDPTPAPVDVDTNPGPDGAVVQEAVAGEAETGTPAAEPVGTADAADTTATELATLRDAHLRLRAEFDNYKKRTARENDEFRKYASEALLKEMLPVLDNLDRAIEHADESPEEKLLEGITLIHKQLMDTLSKFGVSPIAAAGERFDPSVHQAVSQAPRDDVPEGHVAEEFRKGFYYRERVLRPTMVVVASKPAG